MLEDLSKYLKEKIKKVPLLCFFLLLYSFFIFIKYKEIFFNIVQTGLKENKLCINGKRNIHIFFQQIRELPFEFIDVFNCCIIK